MTSTMQSRIRATESAAVVFSMALTSLTALGLGTLELIDFMGVPANRTDYATATGLFAGGGVLLLLTPAIVRLLGLRSWLGWTGVVGGVAMACLAVASAAQISGAPPGEVGDPGWTNGAVGILSMPWNWCLPLLLLLGVATRMTSGPRRPDAGCADSEVPATQS